MKKIYFQLIGIIIFAIILTRVDYSKMVKLLFEINISYFCYALFLVLLNVIVKGMRWNYIKRLQKINYALMRSVSMYSASEFLSIFTPGRLGELAKVFYLIRDGHSPTTALSGVVIDRVSEFLIPLLIFYLGSYVFSPVVFQGCSMVLLIVLLFFLFLNMYSQKIRSLASLLCGKLFKKLDFSSYKDFINDFRQLSVGNVLVIMTISSISRFNYFCAMYLIFIGIGLSSSPYYVIYTVSFAAMISILPISIGGLGTRDATIIYLLSQIYIEREAALLFSFSILLMALITASVGVVFWLKSPLHPKTAESTL